MYLIFSVYDFDLLMRQSGVIMGTCLLETAVLNCDLLCFHINDNVAVMLQFSWEATQALVDRPGSGGPSREQV